MVTVAAPHSIIRPELSAPISNAHAPKGFRCQLQARLSQISRLKSLFSGFCPLPCTSLFSSHQERLVLGSVVGLLFSERILCFYH